MKINLVFREIVSLIREHKFYFLAPILVALVLLAALFFKTGPGIMTTFVYSGL
jgi:hypothetical protein